MKKIIGFDIDGVLTDEKGSHHWEEELVKYFDLEIVEDDDNNRLEARYKLTEEQMIDFFKNRSHFVFPKLTMRSGANTLLQELKEAGFTIILVTARTSKPETAQWLQDHQIPYDLLIEESEEKLEPCVANGLQLFVEDTYKNAEAVSVAMPVLLMNTDYNQVESMPDNIYRVQDFDEIRDFVFEYFQSQSA